MLVKILEVLGLMIFGIPAALGFLALPVIALWWLPHGKIFVIPGHVVAGRGILLRASAPITYWVYLLFELTLCPLIGFGLLVSTLSTIGSIVAP